MGTLGGTHRKIYDVGVDETARRLGVHVETVRRYARTGKVPALKTLSGAWMFSSEDLDALDIHEVVVDA